MRVFRGGSRMLTPLLLLGALPAAVLGGDILSTNGFSTCSNDSDIQVQKMNIEFNRATNKVDFDVAGTSAKEQNVTASLIVTAYGKQVYQKDFNPCDQGSYVAQLCPVPAGSFAASGSQEIPSSYASQIPALAFTVPDLDGQGRLELKSLDSNQTLACIESVVNNGKTAAVPAVGYIAAGIAAAALLLSGLAALGPGMHAGTTSPSPTFSEVIGWFQSMAMNGMLSVPYPPVYRSFARNFAFSTGLVQWDGMQIAIDKFRERTGGNLTDNSVAYLRNATLVYQADSSTSSKAKRGLELLYLHAREFSATVNGTTIGESNGNSSNGTDNKVMHYVEGVQAYVEALTIPEANTFMTVLLVFAVIIAAIAVGILLLKVILETWALFGSFPKRLTGFRKRYWWLLAKTITNLILLLYGVWVLYCVYQFTNGDSWAAKVLAGVTLGLFTAVLAYFSFKIWQKARRYKKADGDVSMLFDDKKTWVKYSLFYDSYKKSYWWLFVPSIVYMFAKGCVIAGGQGHGFAQTVGQLVIESLMLILLLWSRPYALKSGNWINVIIQVVRVLSVVCILVFVQQLGISQSTKTITGLVLIVMQSTLTGLLAILIAVNAIIICCRQNPHRKKRKQAEEMKLENFGNLTPLDARNSLLLEPTDYRSTTQRAPLGSASATRGAYESVPHHEPMGYHGRPALGARGESGDQLLSSAASMGGRTALTGRTGRSHSPAPSDVTRVTRAPTLPSLDSYNGGRAY